ncbi:hypothetical protein R3P38DRAFT_2998519 [Favolaschia claudopus]|uniref:Secreted protein n=1 Tax=Favolaschia claudopus TaxID=2862362 RepID=A0AAW0ANN9_9AGAR
MQIQARLWVPLLYFKLQCVGSAAGIRPPRRTAMYRTNTAVQQQTTGQRARRLGSWARFNAHMGLDENIWEKSEWD